MILLIDFDGTLFEHKYPKLGLEIPHAFDYLRKFQKLGCKLILWTMRSGKELASALEACEIRGIKFWDVNKHPYQHLWTDTEKPDATLCIDDRNLGCPLMESLDEGGRPMVDWKQAGEMVLQKLKL